MRVPIPLVILLVLSVVGGVWWYGSKDLDFLTPPSEASLATIRSKVEESLPPADHPLDAVPTPVIEEPPPPPPVETKPEIELGDLSVPPHLDEYAASGEKGAAYLIELAALLEAEGQFQRALLAWERVLDSAKSTDADVQSAIAAIKRLRPTLPDWNTDPTKATAITLEAGTGRKTAKLLTPILVAVASELEKSSAGLLKVTAKVTAGKDQKNSSTPSPVAIWLSGSAKESRSTEVLSFTVGKPETLPDEVRLTVFRVLRGYLGHKSGQSPPPALGENEPAVDAFTSHVSRLLWNDLGVTLNHPPEKSP